MPEAPLEPTSQPVWPWASSSASSCLMQGQRRTQFLGRSRQGRAWHAESATECHINPHLALSPVCLGLRGPGSWEEGDRVVTPCTISQHTEVQVAPGCGWACLLTGTSSQPFAHSSCGAPRGGARADAGIAPSWGRAFRSCGPAGLIRGAWVSGLWFDLGEAVPSLWGQVSCWVTCVGDPIARVHPKAVHTPRGKREFCAPRGT